MKILLIGQGPLPVEGGEINNAPGFRAWYFARALVENGHEVILVAVRLGGDAPLKPPVRLQDGITFTSVPELEIHRHNYLGLLETQEKPDAVLASGVWPGYLASLYLSKSVPLWIDLFGSPMAEAQAKAALYADDSLISPFARYEKTALSRGDVFSAVATSQKYAIVGALGHQGRLNSATYGYTFAYSIPAGTGEELLPHNQQVIKGKIVPENAFTVLWSGGYNTWTDIDTLFLALEEAMSQVSTLHFVSTGGELPFHDSTTYPHFCELIEQSQYRDRYHLLGWRPYEEVHNYYYEADLGIILDKWSYEGELGSRTRIVDWLKYGLPVVTTVTSELTRELVEAQAGFAFNHGNVPELAELLVNLSKSPQTVQGAKAACKELVRQRYLYNVCSGPLLEWAARPYKAPDAETDRPDLASDELERQLANLAGQIEEKNAQIAGLERWAKEMEITLQKQARSQSLVSRILKHRE